jgi:hypothetical protein
MQGRGSIREEHRKACDALKALMLKGTDPGANGPLPEDMNQYHQLNTIKETLEWVHSDLIQTSAKRGDPNYLNELMGRRYWANGPVDAALTWPRR